MRLWWYNNVKRHWFNSRPYAWWYGVPRKVRVGRVTKADIAWAESTFDGPASAAAQVESLEPREGAIPSRVANQ